LPSKNHSKEKQIGMDKESSTRRFKPGFYSPNFLIS